MYLYRTQNTTVNMKVSRFCYDMNFHYWALLQQISYLDIFSTSWNNSCTPYYALRFNMMAFFSLYLWKIMGCLFCVFAHSNVQYFVLSNVITSFVLCCDVRYDFRIKTMFGSSWPPVVYMRAHVLFTLFVFACA